MDAGRNQRRAGDPPAEDIAVPDEDLVAETLEAVAAAIAAVLPDGEDAPRHPRREIPGTPPETGTGQPGVVTAGDGTTPVPRGPQVPGPPSGEPAQQPPPDPGYALGSDVPIGIGEDSPMNEGSEDTAAPRIDPTEHRLGD
ncbi:MAG: hypothetical protein V7603_4922 [Micromonosporaceae bacterium]